MEDCIHDVDKILIITNNLMAKEKRSRESVKYMIDNSKRNNFWIIKTPGEENVKGKII